MQTIVPTVLAACFLAICTCGLAVGQVTPAPDKDVAAVVAGGNALATDLYQQLAAQGDGNLFYSPESIHTALAMTYAGAAGNTAKQMAATLHYPLSGDALHAAFGKLLADLNAPGQGPDGKPAYQLSVANALWGQAGFPFKDAFTQQVKKNYAANLTTLDFVQSEPARQTINGWVAQQTKDKIKDLIPGGALNRDTRLVLTNAIYFKSAWLHQFQKAATRDGPFTLADGKTAQVPLMHQTEHHAYLENEDFQALSMPYQGDELSMVVFLPRKTDGLKALEKTFTGTNLNQWLGKLQPARVEVTLPRFKVTSQFSLADTLKALGMTDAFDARADFSAMTSADKLCISAVIHKAFVAVDEEGTEAAAATAVMMATMSLVQEPPLKVFTADHPFLFVIRHNATGSILFAGRVTNPAAQ